MNIEVVRKFLALPTDKQLWGKEGWRLLRDRSAFLSINWGEETEEIVSCWNRIFPGVLEVTCTAVDATNPAGFTHKFSCKGRTSEAPYTGTRNDCFIALLALNQVVKHDVDMRFCKDSVGNSDLCFLPLPPADWMRLESEFGAETLAGRFLSLPATFEDFEKYLG